MRIEIKGNQINIDKNNYKIKRNFSKENLNSEINELGKFLSKEEIDLLKAELIKLGHNPNNVAQTVFQKFKNLI